MRNTLITRPCMFIIDHIPLHRFGLGWLAPWVFGLAIGRWPRRVEEDRDP